MQSEYSSTWFCRVSKPLPSWAANPRPKCIRWVTTQIWLQNVDFNWIPFILLAILAAASGQNSIRCVQATFAEQTVIF